MKTLKIKVIKKSGKTRDVKVDHDKVRGYAIRIIRSEAVSESSHDAAKPVRKFGF